MAKHTAIYLRVSVRSQDTRGQETDLKRWARAQPGDQPVRWYRDRSAGKPMERPGFDRLMADLQAGKVGRVVVWRLDRLGRTARGLTALFQELLDRGVGLISTTEGLDLATPAGRLAADVLAGVSAYEKEARAERIMAGQAAAREAGKTWGGSPKGRRLKVSPEQETTLRRLKGEGMGVSAIARAVGLSRPTIYRVLRSEPARRSGRGRKGPNVGRGRPARMSGAGEE